MRLASHPEPLHQGGRRCVVGVALAGDAMKAKPLEAHAQHGGGCLDPIALALVVRVYDEADLALEMLTARAPHAEIADQRVAPLEQCGESEGIAAGSDIGQALEAPEPLADVVTRPRSPVEVAVNVLATVDRDHRLEVVIPERTEDQPLGEDRKRGGHRSIIEDVASEP